jgi:hypothetical protein
MDRKVEIGGATSVYERAFPLGLKPASRPYFACLTLKNLQGNRALVLLLIESKLLAFTITSTLYATLQRRLPQTCKTIS